MEQSGSCHIAAVFSPESGVGSTTTAVNLSQAFAWAGQATLLVDLDPAAEATDRLGVARADTRLLERILRGEDEPSKIGLLVRSVDAGLDLIPADAAELEAPSTNRLRESFEVLLPQYRWIIIDCPPGNGSLSAMARELSHSNIEPVPEASWSTREASESRVMTFATRHRPMDVGLGAVPHDEAVPESQKRKSTLLQAATASPAARAYVQIARRMMHGIQKAR